MSLEMFEIIAPALVAGVMISLVHGLLGIKVLQKNIIFIDLAIAQIAGMGLIIANLFLKENSPFLAQIIALFFALAATIFFYYIEKISPEIEEAIIGCTFILASSLTILFLSNHANSGNEIKHLLSGQILFITWQDIFKHAPIYIAIITIWFLLPKIRNNIGFYLIFAIAITSSVQLVGVYVVFASLILPALAAKNKNNQTAIAWLCGIISVFVGIILAAIFDLPAGGLIVISYLLTSLIIRRC